MILVAALAASPIDFRDFLAAATAANNWILAQFGWLFGFAAFAAVILVGVPGLVILLGCGAVLIRLTMIGPKQLNKVK